MEPPSKAATRRARPEQDRSTISASGGQGRGVVGVGHLQTGGGARRWLTRWRTLLTTTTPLSQRAEPSPLWSRLCPETRIGRGLARIPRVGCDNGGGAVPGVSPRRLVRRTWRGRKWREDPQIVSAGAPPGRGDGACQSSPSPPRFWTPHHLSRGGGPFRMGSLPPQ